MEQSKQRTSSLAQQVDPSYTVFYNQEHDFLEIRFVEPREIVYDYDEDDEGVYLKRDKATGKIVALGVAEYKGKRRHRSRALKEFLARFKVKLPDSS